MLYILLALSVFSVAADQITKALIYGHDSDFIKGFIRFASVENRGAAWGFLNDTKGGMLVLTVLTAVVTAGLIFLLIKHRDMMPKQVAIPLALVIGGAIGNLIDRVFIGYVRDFICTEFISFPVFNFADICVTVGGIALAAAVLFTRKGREYVNRLFPDDKNKVKK